MRRVGPVLLVVAACSGPSSPRASTGKAPPPAPDAAVTLDAVETWISRLDDPAAFDRAVEALDGQCDPRAIPALGKAWEAHDRPLNLLRIIIDLSRPMTPTDAMNDQCTHYRDTGRAASWEASAPFLRQALEVLDVEDERSIDSAALAAEAFAEAPADLAVPPLIAIVEREMAFKSAGQRARGIAIKALGALQDLRAMPALAAVIAEGDREVPPIVGGAINALGEMHDEATLPVLIPAMYRHPAFFIQIRRALVGTGPALKAELRKILRGEGTEDLAEKEWCDDAVCRRIAPLDYYAAIVIGDVYDVAAVDDLLAALEMPETPAYYDTAATPGPTAHVAILDALGRIGAPEAADEVLAIVGDAGTKREPKDVQLRAIAAHVYAFVSADGAETYRGKSGLAILGALASDNGEDEDLRLAAAESLGWLVSSTADAAPLRMLAAKYAHASREKRVAGDRAEVLRAFERAFEAHLARVEIAARCAGDPACLMRAFDATPDEVFEAIRAANRDAVKVGKRAHVLFDDPWSDEDKAELRRAQIERAVLELRRLGRAASGQVEALLAELTEPGVLEDRVIREVVQLTLPRIAELPCDGCALALEGLLVVGEGRAELTALAYDTELALAYFGWAGR